MVAVVAGIGITLVKRRTVIAHLLQRRVYIVTTLRTERIAGPDKSFFRLPAIERPTGSPAWGRETVGHFPLP